MKTLLALALCFAQGASAASLYFYNGVVTEFYAGLENGGQVLVRCAPPTDCTSHATLILDDAGNALRFTYSDKTYDLKETWVCQPLDPYDCTVELRPVNAGYYDFDWFIDGNLITSHGHPDNGDFAVWTMSGHFENGAVFCCDGGYHHVTESWGMWTPMKVRLPLRLRPR